ncbi:unnamed protein product [Closterium sp. NIES-54]
MDTITVVAASGGRQQQPRPPDTLSPEQLREWVIQRGRSGPGAWDYLRAGGTGQQRQSRRQETLSPQQLREWVIQRGRSGPGAWDYLRAGGTGQQRQSRRQETLPPQHLREWVIQRGRPCGGGYVPGGTRQQQQQQSQPETPSPQQPREWFSQRRVSSSVGAAALGASESASALGASAFAATSASESAASASALHTFTLDSGASRCFFRDCTTVTPLAAPVPVSLADPSWGPVVAQASTVQQSPPALFQASTSPSWVQSVHPDRCVCTGGCVRSGGCVETGVCVWSVHCVVLVRVISYQTLLWHHRLNHPSLSRLRSMHSRLLVSGPCPPLPRSPAPPCLPCVEGRQRAAPHSSSFPPTTTPLQTLHMDVWGPAPISGTHKERYFLLVIRATRHQLRERFRRDLRVLRLHSDTGGEFSSDLLAEFCRDDGIIQSFTLPASPQQNGIAERRIGLIMEVGHTSMINVAAPHFLWPFVVRYAAHQLNRVSLPETSPTLRWTGEVGDASAFRVWGALSLVHDTTASKLSPCTLRYAFLCFPTDAPPWQFCHPCSRRVFSSQDVTFDESVCFYRLHPHASHPVPLAPLFVVPVPPPVYPLPPQGLAPSGVSQVDPPPLVEPLEISSGSSCPAEGGDLAANDTAATRCSPCLETPPGFPPRPSSPPLQPVAVDTGTAGGGDIGGEDAGGAETRDAGPGGEGSGGAETGGATSPSGRGAVGAPAAGPGCSGAGAWSYLDARAAGAGGTTRAASAGGAGGTGGTARGAAGAGVGGAGGTTGGSAGAGGAGGAGAAGAGGAAGVADSGAAPGGAGAAGPGGARTRGAGAARAGGAAGARGAGGATGGAGTGKTGGAGAVDGTDQSQPLLLPGSPFPATAPPTEVIESLTERRELETRASTPVCARRVARPRPPFVPDAHGMELRPSSVPQYVVLPEPPASSLPHVPDPESDLARAASPTVTRLLATIVTDPHVESTAAFALVTELVDFAARSRLDYVANPVTQSKSISPPSVGGEPALRSDALEDRRFELECLAAALPRFASMLLCPEEDPDALDIPTSRSYAEAIAGTYVDEVPPHGASIVDGMWIFRVKQPSGSPPAFKARYVARGFTQRQGVDFFHTFSPTPKMTTLRVLLHVAAQRDYELHSLDFSTAFLRGSLHEEIWLRRPLGFTGSFPAGTQWSLRQPVYGLRQAPREWHDTQRTTLAALGFAPSSADPSLFLRTDTTLPLFYVLVYVDELVFAIADTEALALVKAEL